MSVDTEQGVVLHCENGHDQRIAIQGMDRSYAQEWAALLDGTSDMYVYKPRDHPLDGGHVARCGACGAFFTATLFGFDDDAAT